MLGAIETRRSGLIRRQTTDTKHAASVCTSTGPIDTSERNGANELNTASGDKHSVARQLKDTCTTSSASNHHGGHIAIGASDKQSAQPAASTAVSAPSAVSVRPGRADHNKIRTSH
jgi:hypothetical protein